MRRMVPALLLPALLLLATATDALADEDAKRTIALPPESLSLELPAGWTLDQYDAAPLVLARGRAKLWVYAAGAGDEAPATRLARQAERLRADAPQATFEPTRWAVRGASEGAQLWYAAGEELRVDAALARPDGSGLTIEGLMPKADAALVAEMRALLASFDARAFANAKVHVDWNDGWTLDFEDVGTPGRDGLWAVLRSPVIDARRRDGPWVVLGEGDPVVWIRPRTEDTDAMGALREVGQRLRQQLGGGPWRLSDVEADRARLVVLAQDAPPSVRMLRHARADTLEFVVVSQHLATEVTTLRGTPARLVLRPGTHPGARVDEAPATRDPTTEPAPTSFPKAEGPPLTFALPSGWTLTKGTSGMRLAQFTVPGPPELEGVVYWFRGRGGNLAQNLERWRGQIERPADAAAPPAPETVTVAEGIEATTLDLVGTYVAAVRPGAPQRHHMESARLLATYVTCPQGPIMLKLVGPDEAVAKIAAAYRAWIASFRVKAGE